MASAQKLEDSFISLHSANNNGNSPLPQRGAVLGQITVDVPDPADWYRFDLKSGQSATVALSMLEGNDAQVTLVGPNGTTLAVGGSDRNSGRHKGHPGNPNTTTQAMGSPDRADNVDQIISNFLATSSGTYYLKVNSDGGATYNLVVTRNADFDTENNDSIETAQPIVSPEAAGRRWVMGAVEAEARLFAASSSTPFVILELDPESGEIINQIPCRSRLAAFRRTGLQRFEPLLHQRLRESAALGIEPRHWGGYRQRRAPPRLLLRRTGGAGWIDLRRQLRHRSDPPIRPSDRHDRQYPVCTHRYWRRSGGHQRARQPDCDRRSLLRRRA